MIAGRHRVGQKAAEEGESRLECAQTIQIKIQNTNTNTNANTKCKILNTKYKIQNRKSVRRRGVTTRMRANNAARLLSESRAGCGVRRAAIMVVRLAQKMNRA